MPRDTGDEVAAALIQKYARLIRAVVRRVGGQKTAHVADDIEQDVIVAVWRQIDAQQQISYPSSYIYRAAVRETVRAIKAESARRLEPIDAVNDPPATAVSENPHSALEEADRARTIEAAISRLAGDRQRAVRAHLAGYDVDEILEMYGWSYQKARNLITRGVADLRKILRER